MSMAKLSIILSSTKQVSNGQRVFKWLEKSLEDKGHEVVKVDPSEHADLQVFKVRYDYSNGTLTSLDGISKSLKESDGIILLAAEYNHGYTGAMKNVIDTFYPEYKRKPFGIISYSTSGFGGIRANEQLRMVVPELGGILNPKTIMISKVTESLDEAGNLKEQSYKSQFESFITEMEWLMSKL